MDEEEQVERRMLKLVIGTSRGRNTYGYTMVSLWERDTREWTGKYRKVASTCGGNYDLQATVFAEWLAKSFAERFLTLTEPMDGLLFINPKWKGDGNHGALSSKVPTDQHTHVSIDYGGRNTLERLAAAIGVSWSRQSWSAREENFSVTIDPMKKEIIHAE
jgi:hypothetical protein